MGGVLQRDSFDAPDYDKFSDDGTVREQALADNGDRRRCLRRPSPAAPPCIHACSSSSLALRCNAVQIRH